MSFKISYYNDYMSENFAKYLLAKTKSPFGVQGLSMVGEPGGLENKESLNFLVELYQLVQDDLKKVLDQRIADRKFIDSRTLSCKAYNEKLKNRPGSIEYKTILGEKDSKDRIIIGPHSKDYVKSNNKAVAEIPGYLQGYHVTLFGPPDNAKMCVNAMNAFHRKLKGEPAIVSELVNNIDYTPKWGADNEDSKTPMHEDLKSAGVNLSKSLDHDLNFTDEKGKEYKLADSHLSHAIKRFPGLALPSFFLFYNDEPMPLHLYDFALHVFKNWHNPEALVFYVPKLENEEEARYIHKLMENTEKLIQKIHPEYKLGTIRLMIVLENPRAVFRVNEIMDELYPYFVGASLGWHDYLGSTARLFKNDPNYRIPVKADPDIVIKYIKASHHLLSDVVGERGGIKVGGMYGILPITYDLESSSLQVTIYGYIRDVITQLKRNLNGFWVAHPDFVRIGIALVEAWKRSDDSLEKLVKGLLQKKYHKEIMDFINGADIEGLDLNDPLYARSLIVADVGESNIIANNHPDEIRYNVFQSLQYITDWLTGNGCVALPTVIADTPVRIMDDLATAERSRWEVWHEIHHNRFDLFEFLKIAHEELHFIRKDLSNDKKIVQVKWSEENAKWYPVAMKLMIKLMTDDGPAEFAPELLLPFTVEEIREANDPWTKAFEVDPVKFSLKDEITRFNYYFENCGELSFAKILSKNLAIDINQINDLILAFDKDQIINAAYFHGNIGESKATLDHKALQEQAGVEESLSNDLSSWGKKYQDKFGFKFLVSAKGKSGQEMLDILKKRYNQSYEQELNEARLALFEITKKRIVAEPLNQVKQSIENLKKKFKVPGLQVALTFDAKNIQTLSFGKRDNKKPVEANTFFEIASLSKTIGTALALEIFKKQDISLDVPVNKLLERFGSDYQIPKGDKVQLQHLMNHSALNMHYVNGVPLGETMPEISEFLQGLPKYGYEPIAVANEPGTKFQYSGAGFILLEYLVELITKKKFSNLLLEFLRKLNISELKPVICENYAFGYKDNGVEVSGTRMQFPLIAAGMMGSARGMLEFLTKLYNAYKDYKIDKTLSHDTAVSMLYGQNLGSREFMNCDMGLGVFTTEMGKNRVMIHQGANDGYRALFLYCFHGPDEGKGFSVCANGELEAVHLIAQCTQLILKEMSFSGIDFDLFVDHFAYKNMKQEEVVNLGYKQLIFNAFESDLPEIYKNKEIDPLNHFNILIDAQILSVTDQSFARASNLLSAFKPVFEPEAFGRFGKLMDSWESKRHNYLEKETLHLKLKKSSDLNYAFLSTEYHDGNQVEFVEILGLQKNNWIEILPKTSMEGHSYRKIKVEKIKEISEVKVFIYPDGGFTRLGLYNELPEDLKSEYKQIKDSRPIRFSHPVPIPAKPLYLDGIEASITIAEDTDLACEAFGAKIISSTNEHYSPSRRILSPYGSLDMFDGLENARSRDRNNKEEVIIQLAKRSKLERVDLDFRFFINNNPQFIEIYGKSDEKWKQLVKKDYIKPFRGNFKSYKINDDLDFSELKIILFPDGGLNRVHVYGKK